MNASSRHIVLRAFAAAGLAACAMGTGECAWSAAQAAGPTAAAAPVAVAVAAASARPRQLEWEDLIPPASRANFRSGPPPPIHDYLGEGGLAAQQPLDFEVNPELRGLNVRIPGFIVPLDVGQNGLVNEFFLVPYFGACIHVPPPPPNQIVHVRAPQGIALDSIYEAYWISGRMTVENRRTRLGAAAYAMVADAIEIYKY